MNFVKSILFLLFQLQKERICDRFACEKLQKEKEKKKFSIHLLSSVWSSIHPRIAAKVLLIKNIHKYLAKQSMF